MSDQEALSALRERVGKLEVVQDHQADQLNDCAEQTKKLVALTADQEHRLADIEQLLKFLHTIIRWGLASVGTMLLEAMTGALRAILKMLSALGNG